MSCARVAGIPVISQMQLFLELCRGQICGISGSSGKSTTTALVGEMAKAAGAAYTLGGEEKRLENRVHLAQGRSE